MRWLAATNISFGKTSTNRLTKLKRTPRIPARCMACNSVSLISALMLATPRAILLELVSASITARLSVPWQVACTITLRLNPKWSRKAHNCSFDASQGVYLRSSANGNLSPGPNTWQCESTASFGNLKTGLDGLGCQTRQSFGVISNFSWAIVLDMLFLL